MKDKVQRDDVHNMKPIQTIGIIGGGAWGTALALTMLDTQKTVCIFTRNSNVVIDINQHHLNSVYLPHIHIPPSLTAMCNYKGADTCDALLLAVPAQHMRAQCTELARYVSQTPALVICAKGIETSSGQLMHDIVKSFFPNNDIAVLSGPTFASEVAQGKPTAVTIAASSLTVAKYLAEQLGSRAFRPYASDDIIGAQIAGAIKNVIAIGCGIVIGKGLGENARAAFMTRGLREMTRLAITLGGRQETMMGLAGIGDLVLTCGSAQSRNMSLGIALGQGTALQNILSQRQSVAEGVSTALAAQQLANQMGVAMPIIDAIASVLHQGANIDDTIAQLLARPFTAE
jgi:glycerol-3-phosphate dehydrogenase (NAD(P)+)